MTQTIFINLPVSDLSASTEFYQALGATKNDQFSSEANACMTISDTISVMLLTHERWRDFTSKTIPDAHASSQMLLCLSAENRDACDAAIDAAVKAGGKADPTPKQDHGFMYGRSYEDPDGHIWEVMWMDEVEMKKAMDAEQSQS